MTPKDIQAKRAQSKRRAFRTLAASSDMKIKAKGKTGTDLATAVGEEIAKKAKAAGIETVVFDKGPYLFHGRVKALAEAARAGGLKF